MERDRVREKERQRDRVREKERKQIIVRERKREEKLSHLDESPLSNLLFHKTLIVQMKEKNVLRKEKTELAPKAEPLKRVCIFLRF